jgi:hypothetical protein
MRRFGAFRRTGEDRVRGGSVGLYVGPKKTRPSVGLFTLRREHQKKGGGPVDYLVGCPKAYLVLGRMVQLESCYQFRRSSWPVDYLVLMLD